MLMAQRSLPHAGVTTPRCEPCKLCSRKYRLTTVNPPAYPTDIGKTVPIGFGDLRMLADNRLSAVFLRPCALTRIHDQWVGLSGETFGSAGANVPVRQPRSVPAHPFGDGKRAFNTNVGGRTMLRHAVARSERESLPNTLTDLVNEALRAAALAPTYIDALDITGSALTAIAELARVEVRHG